MDRPGTFRSSLAEGGRAGGIPEEGSCFASIQDLRAATQDFSESQIVGKGGFATVYKVWWGTVQCITVEDSEVQGTEEYSTTVQHTALWYKTVTCRAQCRTVQDKCNQQLWLFTA